MLVRQYDLALDAGAAYRIRAIVAPVMVPVVPYLAPRSHSAAMRGLAGVRYLRPGDVFEVDAAGPTARGDGATFYPVSAYRGGRLHAKGWINAYALRWADLESVDLKATIRYDAQHAT